MLLKHKVITQIVIFSSIIKRYIITKEHINTHNSNNVILQNNLTRNNIKS